MANIKNKPLAYQLGYNEGKTMPSDINYEAKMHIPVNSFSSPKIQTEQYKAGWKAGRQLSRRKEKEIFKERMELNYPKGFPYR